MPFQIIRNDITKMTADAIVNTANPEPVIGGGTDSAIYKAAGEEKLLAARKKIGKIPRGEAVVTPAFALSAKYIIHTVGPQWEGGEQGEFEILRDCYRNSLRLAEENGCESIAFPLIATGVYGFPKDKALQIATAVIRDFLLTHEMLVLLVVFDRNAFALSGKVFSDVKSYIDDNYVKRSYHREYQTAHVGAADQRIAEKVMLRSMPSFPELSDMEEASEDDGERSLDEILDHAEDTFQERLFQLIDRSGMDDITVYKKANITKKVFSDIKSKRTYTPSKKTAVALIIALELPMDEAKDLLARAGMALSPSSRFDLIIEYFISHGIYDMMTINETLFAYKQNCLGT